ncbi:HopJ type III effector protein [Algibacillus agarilyticus]|uniref:HopJ type III effector protein n=1 Tax=Algibacillus agarilyticus TaxID=2234133 RepID=UPI000DCF8A32|nr:HopJ type III effector protein [Algibacillus agarilyticus]
MSLTQFLTTLENNPLSLDFEDTMAVIDNQYDFTPTQFTNGDTVNEAGQNNGSCKIFAFAQLNDLNPESTLALFGRYYRQDVLEHPNASDHQNIRNFMIHGWSGIKFEQVALSAKV